MFIKLAITREALLGEFGPEFIELINKAAALGWHRFTFLTEGSRDDSDDFLKACGVALPSNIGIALSVDGYVIGLRPTELSEAGTKLSAYLFGPFSGNNEIVWLDSIDQLFHLLTIESGSGIALMLGAENTASIRSNILKSFQGAADKLQRTKSAYVFTSGRLGRLIKTKLETQGYEIRGFLDNRNLTKTVDGIDVVSLNSINDKDAVFLIGTTIHTHEIKKQLKDAGFENFMSYPVLSLMFPDLLPEEIPYIGIHQDLVTNRSEYISLYARLGDERSREVLGQLLKYRLTYNTNEVTSIADPAASQYFDKGLIQLSDIEVFVDAGGFDGETSKFFIENAGNNFKRIYYFEPDANLNERSRHNLAAFNDIRFYLAGLYSRNGTVRFSTTGTVNGSVSNDGDLEILVMTADDVLTEPATFIKMDIEGAEYDALAGAAKQIRDHAPRLAVAAYHKGEDLWKLAQIIQNLNNQYTFYLRHYTNTGLESVIYALSDRHKNI